MFSRLWTHLWKTNFVGMSFFMGTLALALFAFVVSGCDVPTPPTSDSKFSYASGAIPIDHTYYTIAGTVIADVTDKETGQAPGKIVGSSLSAGNYASISGTYFPGDVQVKGFVRLQIESATPQTELAPLGKVTLLKTTDLKAVALLPGDYVVFVCRAQYEAVAAVAAGESFDHNEAGTWELDYCRLKSPVVGQ